MSVALDSIKYLPFRRVWQYVLDGNDVGMQTVKAPANRAVAVQQRGAIEYFVLSVIIDIGNINVMGSGTRGGTKGIKLPERS